MNKTNLQISFLTALVCALAPALRAQDATPVPEANPLYSAWKGQEGRTATFNRTESRSGGAPMRGGGDGRTAPASSVQFTLSEISAAQATIKVAANPDQPAETLVISAKLMPDDPAFPKSAGTEDLKIGDKTYHCARVHVLHKFQG